MKPTKFAQQPKALQRRVLRIQKSQMTAYGLYSYLASHAKDPEQARILSDLGDWELRSYKL